MIICIPVPISFLTRKGHRNIKNDIGMDGDTYDHSLQLHYRQYLVGLLFADLPSLSPPSFHEMIFILVIIYIHYNCTIYRQFLFALLFADLPSLSPSFHEMTYNIIVQKGS